MAENNVNRFDIEHYSNHCSLSNNLDTPIVGIYVVSELLHLGERNSAVWDLFLSDDGSIIIPE